MSKTQFDRQDVLNKATSLFWRVGYSAASMQALFNVTGLKPGSVYLAFGNKEGLFKESIDSYAASSIEKLNEKLNQKQAVDVSICEILLSFVEESTQVDYCSCFLVKSQLELDDELEIKQRISMYLLEIENIYAKQLETLYSSNEAAQKATSIMVHIFGIRVYGYHSNSKQQMLNTLKLGLAWLPWLEFNH